MRSRLKKNNQFLIASVLIGSTSDQIFYSSPSISVGFSKPKPGFRTILAIADFSKAPDSVWRNALDHKLVSAGLPSSSLIYSIFPF